MEEKIYTGIDKSLDEMNEKELYELKNDYMEMVRMIDDTLHRKSI